MADIISPQDLQKRLEDNQKISLIDVRRKSDYQASPQRIANANWYDPEKLDEWINTISKDEEVVVYCVKGGSVSQSVANQLKQKQCKVKFLEGGIKAWNEIIGLAK